MRVLGSLDCSLGDPLEQLGPPLVPWINRWDCWGCCPLDCFLGDPLEQLGSPLVPWINHWDPRGCC